MLHKIGGHYFFQFSHVAPKVVITLFSIIFYVAQKWWSISFSIFSCCTKRGGHSFFNFLLLHQKWWSFFFQFSHVAPKVVVILFSIFSCCTKSGGNSFSIFSHCTKSGGKLQEDLVKSDYKTNREIKKSRNSITCWQTTRT
jgi:hypothetical protein